MKSILLLRTYYGVNIFSDAHGDLGIYEISPIRFPDLIFVTAATIAKQAKHIDLHVIDAIVEKLLPEELLNSLKTTYDYIILKATAPTVKQDLELLRQLRILYPNSRIVLAGHIAKLLKNWIYANMKEIDEVAEEPLDIYMYKFVNSTEDEVGLNDLPSPDYTLISYNNLRGDNGELRLCLQTSRDCVMGCSYCPYSAFYGNNMSWRDTEKVIDDMKQALALGPTNFHFRDQYFTADKKRVTDLCNRIIDEGIEVKWVCETRLDNVDNKLVDLMAKAGMKTICFGVESGSEEILQNFNRKNADFKKMKDIISYINSKNIETLAFYIVGFPKDTWKTVQKTYEMAVELNSAIAKFSEYEPCVFGKNNSVDIDITPDLFNPFENSMNLKVDSILNKDEIRYIVQLFSEMYCFEKDSLKKSYYNVYRSNNNYGKMISQLKRLSTDFGQISEFLRDK